MNNPTTDLWVLRNIESLEGADSEESQGTHFPAIPQCFFQVCFPSLQRPLWSPFLTVHHHILTQITSFDLHVQKHEGKDPTGLTLSKKLHIETVAVTRMLGFPSFVGQTWSPSRVIQCLGPPAIHHASARKRCYWRHGVVLSLTYKWQDMSYMLLSCTSMLCWVKYTNVSNLLFAYKKRFIILKHRSL